MYKIYTIDNCPWCEKAEDLLAFKEECSNKFNIERNQYAREWILNYLNTIKKRTSFPQIFYDNTYIGGYTDLVDHFKKLEAQEDD